jgi:hypothetical protein
MGVRRFSFSSKHTRIPIPKLHHTPSAISMDALKSNIAHAQDELDEQKTQLQEQAELSETAAHIAAKAPVDPQTVIEGVMLWRQIRELT